MDSKKLRLWLAAGAALLVGALMRLWFIDRFPTVAGDTFIYGGIAKNWLLQGVYGYNRDLVANGISVVHPTLIRLPGYPAFLALCFRLFGMEHYRAVMFLQAAADLVTCCLGAALAGRLFGTPAALRVLWIACLCPFTANYVAAPMTETLVLTSIALAFYSFARWQEKPGRNRWLLGVGLSLSASVLLRPEQGLLAAAILPAVLWVSWRRRPDGQNLISVAWPALSTGICLLLCLLPWTIRNWRTFHVLQPLAPPYANDPGEIIPSGFGRWYRTWGIDFASTYDVYWNYGGARIEFSDLPQRAYLGDSPATTLSLRNRTASLLADYNPTMVITRSIDDRFDTLGRERIRECPFAYYILLPVARVADMTLRPRTEMLPIAIHWWRWSQHRAQTAFATTYGALNLLYLALGFAGFVAWRRRRWVALDGHSYRELAWAMAATIALRCALLLFIDNSEPRYTLEFFPVLFVWAGALFAPRQTASAKAL